ncbi:MAG: hypothetical protein ABFD80_03435, partial [Acidobacteriota bacterium]
MNLQTRVWALAILCLSLLLLWNADGGGAQWRGSTKNENGVEVIKNPVEPALKAPVASFKRELSLRTSGSEAAAILERPSHLIVDDAGDIYVADSKASNIK